MGALAATGGVRPLLALAAFVLPFLSACGPTHEWHQRLTITVETPWGVRTGSSVTAVRWEEQRIRFGEAPALLQDMSGEAVVVDVRPDALEGSPRYLFALTDVSGLAPGVMAPSGLDVSERVRAMRRVKGAVPVPPERLPRMVTFLDVNDPMTAVRIELTEADGVGERPEPRPGNWCAYGPSMTLAEAFGHGVHLGHATIELTDESVTDGPINALMPWLPEHYGQRLDGQRFGNIETASPVANSLSSGSFDTERN